MERNIVMMMYLCNTCCCQCVAFFSDALPELTFEAETSHLRLKDYVYTAQWSYTSAQTCCQITDEFWLTHTDIITHTLAI